MANVLFSAMRNEAPFVLEWVAYHQMIGFDKIIIVTNGVTDTTDDILAPMADGTRLIHIPQEVPDGVAPQAAAVALSETLGLLEDGDWGLFLDADEFLNIKIGEGHIHDLTAHLIERNLIGMLINWRVFGDSGHPHFTGRYVSADYPMADNGIEMTQFKTLFRKGEEAVGFSDYLHLCKLAPGVSRLERFLSPFGAPLTPEICAGRPRNRRWLNQWIATGTSPLGRLPGRPEDTQIAQINHYMVRDPHSFQLKAKRGRGYSTQKKNQRHTAEFYQTWNTNVVRDESIRRWEQATTDCIAELTEQFGLQDILERTRQAYLADFSG